jgi:hypothetical protein
MIPNVGKFGLHNVSNDNKTRLADFSVTRNFVISSTMFPHKKKIHKQTWVSPDGLTRNQIDHVMIDVRHASNMIDVRSYRGADCDSNHIMVKIKYRPKTAILNKSTGGRNTRFGTEKFKDVSIYKDYQSTIKDHIDRQSAYDQNNIDQKWTFIKQNIYAAAEETIGIAQPKRINQWFDEECNNAIKWRNEIRKKMLQRKTRALVDEYKKVRREAKTICHERNFLKKTLFWTYRKRMVEIKLRNSLKVSVILKEFSNQEQTYVEIKR